MMTRVEYAHEAMLVLDPGGDPAAPGAAITIALCGHWDHEPPCPVAPHHTEAAPRNDGTVALRVSFTTEPDQEPRVRSLIDQALASGRLSGRGARLTTWTVRS